MNAGSLSDLLLFQKKIITYNGEARSTRWTSDENEGAFQQPCNVERSSETVLRIITRYREGVAPDTYRIIFDSAIWNITSAPHDRRRTQLTIDCDFSEAIEVTHMQSEVREYIDGLPVIRTRE
jgi:Phage head-tail joining protein.